MRKILLVLAAFFIADVAISQAVYNVLDFGVKQDSTINSAKEIQAAIDKANQEGGGMVYFPPGVYMSGTIVLKSNVRFHLESGATLYASLKEKDFENDFKIYKKDDSGKGAGASTPVLIYAKDSKNISIEGKGTIHGRARRTYEDLKQVDGFIADITENARQSGVEMKMYYKVKPYTCMVFLESCEFVNIRDVSLIESTDWTLHFKWSNRVFVEGIYLESSLEKGVNADGIDVDGCKDVVISNSIITAGDDAIVLKSTYTDGDYESCENVAVSNCTLVSTSTALKIGTESYGDFRHITFNNCTIRNSNRGLSVVVRDGATVEDLLFSNITLETDRKHFNWWGNGDPIWLVVKKRRETSKIGEIKNVTFQNVTGIGQGTSKIEGFPEMKRISNIRLDNVHLRMEAEDKPDKRATHIFEVSDAENVTLTNSSLLWDATNGTEEKWVSSVSLVNSVGIQLKNLNLNANPKSEQPLIVTNNASDVLLNGVESRNKVQTLLKVGGEDSKEIVLSGNDLRDKIKNDVAGDKKSVVSIK
ncbi:MAG: hypothetical protein HRT61_16870 [Ekhidna sp.]|nr:hypothetical protein [Ekhidna sp.]